MFDHIVVSYDGSECARAGFEFAAKLAAEVDGRGTLVQAMESPYDALMRAPEPIPGLEELLKEDEAARIEDLTAVAATVPDGAAVTVEVLHGRTGPALVTLSMPAERVSEELREGDPREELLEACRERSPAAVVVGHHGAGRLRSLLLGSTARELVHRATCPVLVVRGEAADPGTAQGSEH